MTIEKAAIAGALESGDCMVTVQPGNGKIELELESMVINQFGEQIRKVVMGTLRRLHVEDVFIRIVDKGALDCTIKARVECAVYRSIDKKWNLPWGDVIQ